MRFGRALARGLLAGALALASLAGPGVSASSAPPVSTVPAQASGDAALAWTGGMDLYRPGVFTTQKTWLWCTAADIQISRNIVFHQTDHSYAAQQRYFNWMRAHNRYAIPLSGGVDAAGWTAGFRYFVSSKYRLYANTTFDAALRSAVTNLRKTRLPVGITVDRGNHAWLITGFTATADPARTSNFTVTSVRVVGPLYGLQSINGYDMPPDTKLTVTQLRHFFTPWYYPPVRMVWDGKYISIQPVPTTVTAAAPAPKPAPTAPVIRAKAAPAPTPTSTPKPKPTPVPTASPVAGALEQVPTADPQAPALARVMDAGAPMGSAAAEAGAVLPSPSASPPDAQADLTSSIVLVLEWGFLILLVAGLATTVVSVRRRRRRR
jgi:hypothetical protein